MFPEEENLKADIEICKNFLAHDIYGANRNQIKIQFKSITKPNGLLLGKEGHRFSGCIYK